MVRRFRLIDREFRRLAPSYANTLVIDRDDRSSTNGASLIEIIRAADLPPFPDIPYRRIAVSSQRGERNFQAGTDSRRMDAETSRFALYSRGPTIHEVLDMFLLRRTCTTLVSASALLSVLTGVAPVLGQAAQTAANAKVWLDNPKTFEDYLKSADVVSMEELKTGVTRPRKAKLAPGGPVEAFAWKVIQPGRYEGFWESYKSEIAAYEMDKALDLGMVPPTVEKRVKGETGAAVMWISPTRSFKDLGGVPGQKGVQGPAGLLQVNWNRQLTRAKMFDNLIGNIDPNLGNWLVDPGWNLVLIDHTRAFTTTKDLYHQLMQVDDELWTKMKALDEASVTTAIGSWVGKAEIRALLQRRDKMQQVVDKLGKSH